jgi:hypothetical protein
MCRSAASAIDGQQWLSELATGGTNAKAKGSVTVIRAFGVLAAILDDAVRNRRTMTSPARASACPERLKREHNYFSQNQVARLAAADGGNGPIVLLLAYCGLRWERRLACGSATATCYGVE